jgi:hypothetical protein
MRHPRCVRELRVERLAISHAASHEVRPFWNGDVRIHFLRKQSPQLRMVPTQFLPRAVAMGADSRSQPSHLVCELLSGECFEIFVHR